MNEKTEDSIKDWLIITTTTTARLFALKAKNIKPLKAYLAEMNVKKLADRIYGRVSAKDFEDLKNGSASKYFRCKLVLIELRTVHPTLVNFLVI